MITFRLGIRNLFRQRWRSGLTAAGVGVSVALMIWSLAFVEGWLDQMVRGATAVATGQLQLQTVGWADEARVWKSMPVSSELLDSLRAVPGVEAVSPRVELYGLVGHERKSSVARILGVDPALEAAATPVVEAVAAGRWLGSRPPAAGRLPEAVLGAHLARQLSVGPGDELVLFAEAADGSLGNDLLTVVGTVDTGDTGIDRGGVYLHIDQARFVAALEGQAHAVLVRTGEPTRAWEVAAGAARSLGVARAVEQAPDEARIVRTWQEILPALAQVVEMSKGSYRTMYLLVYLVAAVGILNTQRMSAQERRREFAVLVAVGMRPRRLAGTLLTEAVVLGVAGGLFGVLLGGGVAWYHAAAGLDLGLLADQASFSYMGVAFDERLFAEVTARSVVEPVLVMVVVAVMSGLWPAWTAARLEPSRTLAGRS